jgi:hypothetical protein
VQELTVHQSIFLAHVEERFQAHAEDCGAHLAALISARSYHTTKYMLVSLPENLHNMKRMTEEFQLMEDNDNPNYK